MNKESKVQEIVESAKMKTFVKNVIFLKSKLTHLRKKYFAENVPNGTGKHCKISCRSVQLFCI